jgi:hypothetical protein
MCGEDVNWLTMAETGHGSICAVHADLPKYQIVRSEIAGSHLALFISPDDGKLRGQVAISTSLVGKPARRAIKLIVWKSGSARAIITAPQEWLPV